MDLVDLLTIKIYPTEGGREDHYFGAETQGFQGLVDQNDRGKVPEKSHLLKETFF